jgi:hypothetical protein
MQHLLFGTLLSFWPTSLCGDEAEAARQEAAQAHLDHYHDATQRCCAMRVPSAAAARAGALAVPMD